MQRLCGQAHRLSHGLHPVHSIPPGGGQIQAGAIKGRSEICGDAGLFSDAAGCKPRKAGREGALLMRGRERTRQRLRAELHRRNIRINQLPEYIPYSGKTCYKYLSGKGEISKEFVDAVQLLLDNWDNKRSARP